MLMKRQFCLLAVVLNNGCLTNNRNFIVRFMMTVLLWSCVWCSATDAGPTASSSSSAPAVSSIGATRSCCSCRSRRWHQCWSSWSHVDVRSSSYIVIQRGACAQRRRTKQLGRQRRERFAAFNWSSMLSSLFIRCICCLVELTRKTSCHTPVIMVLKLGVHGSKSSSRWWHLMFYRASFEHFMKYFASLITYCDNRFFYGDDKLSKTYFPQPEIGGRICCPLQFKK